MNYRPFVFRAVFQNLEFVVSELIVGFDEQIVRLKYVPFYSLID
jgi:hypothetical protein